MAMKNFPDTKSFPQTFPWLTQTPWKTMNILTGYAEIKASYGCKIFILRKISQNSYHNKQGLTWHTIPKIAKLCKNSQLKLQPRVKNKIAIKFINV